MTTALSPCPICGRQPIRNGRGSTGGVRCASSGLFDDQPSHLVQTYGATQADADAAWNERRGVLVATMTRALPDGKMDDSTFEQIETALDHADAPCMEDNRWLTLPERIAALARPSCGEGARA